VPLPIERPWLEAVSSKEERETEAARHDRPRILRKEFPKPRNHPEADAVFMPA